MPGRDDALDLYLQDLRRSAKLSVAQVCERTKIQARYVEALEAGRFGEVPSNTHLRAFSLSIAQACGGDVERAALLVRRVLAGAAPVADAPRSFDTPAPAPSEAVKPLAPRAGTPPPAAPPRLAADGPALAVAAAGIEREAPVHGLAAASERLRKLPLGWLLLLLVVAGALSFGASQLIERWKRGGDAPTESAAETAPSATALAGAAAAAPAGPAAQAAAASAPAALTAAAGSAQAPVELVLRARRPCWVVLEIDGQRLPTVTLQDGEKLRWSVDQRARLLAGNVGALRVWWRGDNLGYLGELGVRANALVFERGKAPRYDKSQALALPPGVPE